MPSPLLVELGCEEIPAGMIEPLAEEFGAVLVEQLRAAQLLGTESGRLTIASTPRRLICLQPEVLEQQPPGEEEVIGPPARLAFAADGKPTPQGAGFAAKNGVTPASLYRVATPKGEYAALKRKTGGASALALLPDLLPRAFQALALPRSMRWGGGLRFIRPVRWLLAFHGEKPVPFRLGDLESASRSFGHRSLSGGAFAVSSASDYPARWQENFVITDPAARKARIESAASLLLAPVAGRLRNDPDLMDTLVNLTEYPDAVLGEFDSGYIQSLPAVVLVTVMRDHQKYFAVEDAGGQLLPRFVAVINQSGDPRGVIRHGHERVLRARFSDAQFFYDTDRKLNLGERLGLLEKVTFQAKLGSYRDKSLRLRALAPWLAELWKQQGMACDTAAVAIAAELAKCDLTTEMVKEFTELQGIMGGYYALACNQSPLVAGAIADQYLWERAPQTVEGAAVSIADKLDTIAGMFAVGEVPSGSADPFGLRRQANGVLRTLLHGGLELPLAAACEQALAGYRIEVLPSARQDLAAFFRERLAYQLREVEGFRYDVVAAVLAAGVERPLDAQARCRALAAAPELGAVAAVVKRARNIVRKENWTALQVDAALLTAPSEQALRQSVEALPADGGYAAELEAISRLAAPLERFFNEVRVNDENPALRANRLSLLNWAVARLSRVADFSELAGESGSMNGQAGAGG